MRKFTAAIVALVMSLVGVMAIGVPAAAEEPGHRAYGALYLAEIEMGTGAAANFERYVSHVSGLGRVSVESFVLNLAGDDTDEDGYFIDGGTYTASGTIKTVNGSTLHLTIANGTFELTESFYYDEDTDNEIHGIAFGAADVTVSGGTGRLTGMEGSGAIVEGFMCQYYRWAALAFDVDLDVS